jgi:SPP1 gp7 family putative phage head morphogenesis protein
VAYEGKFKELEQLYSSHTCCHIETLADDGLLISDAELEAWVKDIYENGKGKVHIPTVKKLAKYFSDAIQAGYGINLNDIDLNTPDADMLSHLVNNCYTFAVAKNKTHLQKLTALINNNGKIREWADYLQEASKLNLKLNKTWLKTEYDLAIAGGTMASKWVNFSSNSDTMLRYSTVGDARVRDSHRLLDGTTLPANHKFWNTAYPPNGFKCRCDVDSIPYTTPATPNNKVPATGSDVIPKLFQVNLAKEKLAFPPKHPYYNAFDK